MGGVGGRFGAAIGDAIDGESKPAGEDVSTTLLFSVGSCTIFFPCLVFGGGGFCFFFSDGAIVVTASGTALFAWGGATGAGAGIVACALTGAFPPINIFVNASTSIVARFTSGIVSNDFCPCDGAGNRANVFLTAASCVDPNGDCPGPAPSSLFPPCPNNANSALLLVFRFTSSSVS